MLAAAALLLWTLVLQNVKREVVHHQAIQKSIASETSAAWPMFHGSPTLQGYIDASVRTSLKLLWSFETEGAVRSSAAIAKGNIYFGSNSGCFYALDAQTGKRLWSFPTQGQIESSPCILDDTVYVGSSDGFLYAFDTNTGDLRWKYETESQILGGINWCVDPESGAKRILVGSYDMFLHCVDAQSGTLVWKYETGNYINGTVAVSDGRIVFGGCDAMVHVVSIRDGSPIDQIDAGSYIPGSAALSATEAFVGHYDSELLCIDLSESQSQKEHGSLDKQTSATPGIAPARIPWCYAEGQAPFFSSPAFDDQRVVVGSRDKKLHCISRKDGAPLWTFQTQGSVDSSPVICRKKVIFGSDDGRLYLVRVDTGELLWSYDIGRPIRSSPAVAYGKVFVGAEDMRMYAFGPD